MKQTYLKSAVSPLKSMRELYALYVFSSRNLERRANDIASSTRTSVAMLEEFSQRKIQGTKVLEIGPGQTKPFLYALGRTNEYIAIDLEIPPARSSLAEFVRIFKENGVLRFVKSLGRHVLGIDAALERALSKEFGGTPRGRFVQGDASAPVFEPESFDHVVSTSVFEHLPDPAAVMRQVSRILKPGGTVLTVTHLYTSLTGAHDPRVFVDFEALPPWAHLNPREKHKVNSNSYLNKLRIADYREIFAANWPGCSHELTGGHTVLKRRLLDQLPASVKSAYTEEELLSDVLISLWKKPELTA